MKRFWLQGAAVAALWTGAGAPAKADDLAPDTITVYATKNPISPYDYPGQASVIERDVILDFNAQTVSDLFDAIPGARFDGGPRRSGEVPSVRGLEGEGVLVLFDGARQSFLSGHDGRFFIDPDLLQAVEVVRGPTSALYGSGALGGVIALRTIAAEDFLDDGDTVGVKLGGGFQSVNDEWRASATAAFRSDDGRFDLIGNVVYRNSGDIRLGSGLDLPADDEILSSLVKARAELTAAVTASASWIHYGGASVDPNNPQGDAVAAPGNELVDRTIDGNTFQGGLSIAPEGSDFLNLNIVGYHTVNEVEEAEIGATRVVSRAVTTTGVSLDNRTRFDLGGENSLVFTYGGEFYTDDQVGRDNATPDGTRGGVPDAKERFYGAFIQGDLTLHRPLGAPGVVEIIPGVRLDKFHTEAAGEPETDDSAVSPKIGATYKPMPEILIFGNWAEAFRAPSFNEIYADGTHFQIPDLSGPPGPPAFVTNSFVANPDLVPEDSQTWEFGAGLDLRDVLFGGDNLTGKASYFESTVTNLIDLEVNIPAGCFGAPVQPCGSGPAFGNFSRYVNVTNATISGVEVEAFYDAEHVYARAHFSTLNGINTDTGDFVGVLAPDRFFIDAGLKLPGAGVRLGARVTAAGAFNEVNDPSLARASYRVGDVYLVWQPAALRGLRLDLGVDNVTDADYDVVAAGVSQPGKSYKAAVSWRAGW